MNPPLPDHLRVYLDEREIGVLEPVEAGARDLEFRTIRYASYRMERVRRVVERVSMALPEVVQHAEARGVSRAFLDDLAGGIRRRLAVCRRQLDE